MNPNPEVLTSSDEAVIIPVGRKHFLQTLALTAAGTFLTIRASNAQTTPSPSPASAARDRGPQIEAALIRQFVGAGHGHSSKS